MGQKFAHADDYLDHLEELFARDESKFGIGGRLSHSVHMLQTAAAAKAAGAESCLVAASLLHDIGHWLCRELHRSDVADNRHELVGAEYLRSHFPDDVTQPIALHVAAKRYLCLREPAYLAELSTGSVRSLALQGGPMSEAEAAAFEEHPAHAHAVALRRWDDYGKIPELEVPGFDYYRPMLRMLMGET